MSTAVSFLTMSQFHELELWCSQMRNLFPGDVPYFVGSACKRADYHDVDIRLILDDETFDRDYSDPIKLRTMNHVVSLWGQRVTHLPIDFQIQRMTEANAEFGGQWRNPMGIRGWDGKGRGRSRTIEDAA